MAGRGYLFRRETAGQTNVSTNKGIQTAANEPEELPKLQGMAGRGYLFRRETAGQTNVSKNEVCQTTAKEPEELRKLQGMAGRGYLFRRETAGQTNVSKNEVCQTTAKEPEELRKLQGMAGRGYLFRRETAGQTNVSTNKGIQTAANEPEDLPKLQGMAGRGYLFRRETASQTNVSKNEVCQTTAKEPEELRKLQGMAGRGYLFRRETAGQTNVSTNKGIQTAANEPEDLPKLQGMAGRGYLFRRETAGQTNVSTNKGIQTAANEPEDLSKLQGMAGRGHFLNNLCQTTVKEPETSLKSQSDNIAAKSPVPKITNSFQPQYIQGRRKLFAQLGLTSPELRNSKDLACPPIFKNDEIHQVLESTTLPQLQSMTINPQQQQPILIEPPEEQKDPVICRVPKDSEKGNYCTTELSSNYIKIELEKSKQSLYEYVVDFNPPVDNKSAQFYLINRCEEFPVKTYHNNLLFIPHLLPQNKTILTGELKDGSKVNITITYKHKKNASERLQFYSILLRSIMKMLEFVEFGRYFFDKNKKIFIPQYKLEIWPGYIITVDEFENGMYVCCDISHRILNVDTVLDKIKEVLFYSTEYDKDFQQEIMALLCNKVVITRYNNKTYRVDDIDFSITPLSTFKYRDSEISFVDYYKKKHDVEIKDLKQPILVVIPKKNNILSNNGLENSSICLVPELCNLTGLSDNMKSDFKLTKAINDHTLLSPNKRINVMIELINTINNHKEAKNKLKNWGLTLCLTPEKIKAPVYKNETILFGQQLRKQIGINMDWGIDVAKSAMFRAVNMSSWAVLYTSRDFSTAKSFCYNLTMNAKPLGMNINRPLNIQVGGNNTEAFVSEINSVVQINPDLQLVVIIFPNQREDRYNAVKRLCCADLGIPSQVIISRTLSKPERLQSITQKIALQINCKLGGACWSIDIPLVNTMIVGIDVYHEDAHQYNSVVGFVASLDKTFTQWCSVSKIQKNTQQEILDCLPLCLDKVLKKFKEKNGMLPDKIIIYRDGVSDGELQHLEKIEVDSIDDLFKSYPGNYCPCITFIVVQKRIHTRIFQLNNNYSNPRPGTVVDNTITRRNYSDFFLVSQNIRQGTVNPSHYIILKNGCKLSPEHLQRLSYKLCHMYYNWTGTIRVPAPVQYAHKLAFLIGQNVKKLPSDKLIETLFFL